MLYLISLGFEEKDLSLKGLEAAKACGLLYLESYTNKLFADTKKLSKLVGKEIRPADRMTMENESDKILEEAKKQNVGVLIPGDALAATTHISLVLDAKRKGIPIEVIHGPSIFTVIGETGLQLYKFGMTTTLPFPEQKSASWYEVIKMNLKNGLHTLVLLDVKVSGKIKGGLEEPGFPGPRYMTIKEAVKILRVMD